MNKNRLLASSNKPNDFKLPLHCCVCARPFKGDSIMLFSNQQSTHTHESHAIINIGIIMFMRNSFPLHFIVISFRRWYRTRSHQALDTLHSNKHTAVNILPTPCAIDTPKIPHNFSAFCWYDAGGGSVLTRWPADFSCATNCVVCRSSNKTHTAECAVVIIHTAWPFRVDMDIVVDILYYIYIL